MVEATFSPFFVNSGGVIASSSSERESERENEPTCVFVYVLCWIPHFCHLLECSCNTFRKKEREQEGERVAKLKLFSFCIIN